MSVYVGIAHREDWGPFTIITVVASGYGRFAKGELIYDGEDHVVYWTGHETEETVVVESPYDFGTEFSEDWIHNFTASEHGLMHLFM